MTMKLFIGMIIIAFAAAQFFHPQLAGFIYKNNTRASVRTYTAIEFAAGLLFGTHLVLSSIFPAIAQYLFFSIGITGLGLFVIGLIELSSFDKYDKVYKENEFYILNGEGITMLR